VADPQLIPVEGNPFEQKAASSGPTLVPVEGNPFEAAPAAPRKGATIPVSFDNMKHDLGTLWNDVSSIPGDIYKGGEALVNRAVHDVQNPRDGIADAVRILRKVNPLTAAYDNAKTIVSDPAKVVRDAATFAAERPASAALNVMTPGTGGKVTAGAGLLKSASTLAKAERLPSSILSGVSMRSLGEMVNATAKGGDVADTARQAMRGTLDGQDVADKLVSAAGKIAGDKNAARAADAQKWNIPGALAEVSDVDAALQKARNSNRTAIGAVKDAQAEAALDAVQKHLDTHSTIPAHDGFGPTRVKGIVLDDMDALKQAVGSVKYDRTLAPPGSFAGTLVGNVYDAAKGAVQKVSPEYAEALGRNQADIRNLQNLKSEFGLKGSNVNVGSVLTKLGQSMRNDVSSRFGAKGKLLEQLAAKDPTIPAAAAGAEMSSWAPRGLAKGAEGIVALNVLAHGGAAFLNPGYLAATLASIPRFQGEARNLVGRSIQGARAGGATQKNLGLLADVLRMNGQDEFDADGTGYDMKTARAAGLGPAGKEAGENVGHWPTRDPRTGMILKGKGHTSFGLGISEDEKLGYKLVKKNGRYYTLKDDKP
jgi:hypothetical protein